MKKRYRKRKSAKVWDFGPWNENADPGDLMVTTDGKLYRLEESNGWGKRALGELTPRLIVPRIPGSIAEIHNDQVYWCW